ncbi:hypothetical protein ES705_37660 [subsurface metagenome]
MAKPTDNQKRLAEIDAEIKRLIDEKRRILQSAVIKWSKR